MASSSTIRVGSRSSELAITQSNIAMETLHRTSPNMTTQLITMTTIGDRITEQPLYTIGEKALFAKELEQALLENQVDIVVHSLKDLPTSLPSDLVIGAIMEREDPRDVLILKPGIDDLTKNAVVGTSSVRRIAQLCALYPTVQFRTIRGNLNTRLRKLDAEDGEYDGIVLAAAGVKRMGWEERISQYLPIYHAVGQGALAVEIRASDQVIANRISKLSHSETLLRCVAERSLMRNLEGGCSVPIGVSWSSDTLTAGVFSLDGQDKVIESYRTTEDSIRVPDDFKCDVLAPGIDLGKLYSAHLTGVRLSEKLLLKGARDILSQIRQSK